MYSCFILVICLLYYMQLSEAFAEMMFKHGFVHCDPHAANVLVRPLPSGSRSIFGEALSRSLSVDFFI